jgi:His-Xaa-Ser system protein HxsD
MQGVAESVEDGQLVLRVDTRLYSKTSLFKSCYKFTDKCYIFLSLDEGDQTIIITVLSPKSDSVDLSQLGGEFFNELLDQQVRKTLSQETDELRNLIVAQAFSEGNLLDESRDKGDYEADPLNIGKNR